MRLFVTGGTGFIGSHFLTQAVALGHDVIAQRRSASSKPRVIFENEPHWLTKSMGAVQPEDLHGVDVLVHLAAAGVSPQVCGWPQLFRTNVSESLSVWLAAVSAKVKRFIICGSCFEYGRSADRYEFIPTDAPLEPTTAYGASKAAASQAAIGLAADYGLDLTIVRPFHVFGDGQHDDNFWPSLRRAASIGEDFHLSPGDQVRDFVHVEKAAHEILSACGRNIGTPGYAKVVHIGGGQPRTLREFAEGWWATWQAPSRLCFGANSYRAGEVMRYVPELENHST